MNDNEVFMMDLISQGVFSVDEQGRIWRHKIRGSRFSDYRDLPEKRRAETKNSGYYELDVSYKGVKYRAKAHRIVWIWFTGNIDDSLTINHINANKLDNRLENLELISLSENVLKAHDLGLISGASPGEKHHNSLLSMDDVVKIRELYATGKYTYDNLADMYPVNSTQIGRIVTGKRWSHLPVTNSEFKRRGSSKLTWKKIHQIRQKYSSGTSIKKLSDEYKISTVQIRRIVNYKAWIE